MMNHLALSTLITSIASISNIILIAFNKPLNKIKVLWMSFGFFVFCWSTLTFISQITTNMEQTYTYLYWAKLLSMFIPIVFYHFCLALAPKNTFKKRCLYGLYIFSFIYMLIALFEPTLFVSNIEYKPAGIYYVNPGFIYHVFVLIFFISFIAGSYELYQIQHYAKGHQKNQTTYILIGTFIGFIGGGTTFLISYDFTFFTGGSYTVPLYVICVTYAIIKHQLFDIRIFIQKSLIYSILLAIITLTYLFFVVGLEWLIQYQFNYHSKLISFFVTLTLGLFIVPLRNIIQRKVDKLLFKASSAEMAEENEFLRKEVADKQKHQAVAALAGGVAHEIRNPLTAIKAFCEHAKTKKDDPEFIDRFERVTFNEIDRIEQLTQQLLDFAKPSKPNFQTVNVNDVIHDTLLLTQNSLKKNNIELVQELAESLPATQADPNQLKQALLNLILNAVDAMDAAGTLTITAANENNRVAITITDTGCGIPKNKLDQIFHPFHSNKSHGTGLGLSIVKTIVNNHHGRITVDSQPNQGTTFKVVI